MTPLKPGFSFSGEEQQENVHLGEGGEHQEEAVSGLQAQHWEATQTGDLCGHQEEV